MQTAKKNVFLRQKRINIRFYNLPISITCSTMRKPFIELFTAVIDRDPPGGGVLPYKGLMGTCGQPGYVFRDFCLKQGIEFIIFCLNQGIDLSIFVLNRMSFLGR